MTTENTQTGADQNPAAGDATSVKTDQAAAGQPAGTDPGAAGTKESDVVIPVSVAKKMREEMTDLKDKNNLLQQQLNLYMANAPAANAPAPAAGQGQPAPQPATVDVKDLVGDLADTDVVTVKDLKKVVAAVQQAGGGDPGTSQNIEHRFALMEARISDPDYENTIRTYLPGVAASDPRIMPMIKASANPIMAALSYAQLNPQYKAAKSAAGQNLPAGAGNGSNPAAPAGTVPITEGVSVLDQINTLIENTNKPGAASQASGPGGVDNANRFSTKAMPDADFDKHVNSILSGV